MSQEHTLLISRLCYYRQLVLIMGGGGAVGLAAIALAKAAGCYVACTCGKRSMEKVKEAGAEEALDYTSPVSYYIL